MGQFFKYKKHEWIFLGFSREGRIRQFWLNKGPDRSGVSSFLSLERALGLCTEDGYDRVLLGHNHPAGALRPSRQDRVSLEHWGDRFAEAGVSLVEYVFVAGRWRRYGLSLGQRVRRLGKRA